MFWNVVQKFRRAFKLSIAARLSVALALLSGLLLTVLSVGLYQVMRHEYEQEEQWALQDFSTLLYTELLREQDVNPVFHHHLYQELAAFRHYPFSVAIVSGKDHRLLYHSREFPLSLFKQKALPLTPIEPQLALTPSPQRPTHRQGASKSTGVLLKVGEGQYRVMHFRAFIGSGKQRPVWVTVTENITQRLAFLDKLQQMLEGLVLLGTVLFSLLSFWAVRQELLPLSHFCQHFQRIDLDSLQEEVTQAEWPLEVKPLATAFNRMLKRLARGVDALTHFSSDLAHELKTPLANMQVEIELLLRHPQTVEAYETALSSNLEDLARLSNLVDRLLILSRLSHAEKTLSQSGFAVLPMVHKLFEYYQFSADEKQIRLSCVGEADAWADAYYVELALSNVLSNALKYTPTAGWIEVRLSVEAQGLLPDVLPEEEGAFMGADERVTVIEVADNGIGIAPEKIPKVVDRFYRVEASRTGAIPGAIPGDGLGLAIVYSVMEAHQGKLVIQSQPGEGTTMQLRFPHRRLA